MYVDFLVTWGKNVLPSRKKVSAGFWKLLSKCPEEFFLKKSFSEKIVCFLSSSDIEREVFVVLAKNFHRIVETDLFVSIGILQQRTNSLIKVRSNFLSGRWEKKFCVSGKFFYSELPKLNLRIPRNLFLVNVFWWFFHYNFLFWTSSENLSVFSRKFRDGVFETATWLPREMWKFSYSRKTLKFFQHFWTLIRMFLFFNRSFFGWVVKTETTCPRSYFYEHFPDKANCF